MRSTGGFDVIEVLMEFYSIKMNEIFDKSVLNRVVMMENWCRLLTVGIVVLGHGYPLWLALHGQLHRLITSD